MLRLNNIRKEYPSGNEKVHALKGVSIDFRSNEFVSILGPSGCGKTTLLNIIGGLDKCSSGDLVIDGVSTKKYKDRDWDTYRNHSIGFVFQSYYLIPHQNVLKNVELSLTLSGVSKAERKRRALDALKMVGLEGQYKKRPNQLSGGQMQRVAIARAIVNNPDIILADEPTGALDTETSIQVMEILKQIANDRLVIMVTHNPELAQQYSTRIIRILDGMVTDDTNPLSESEVESELEIERTKKSENYKKKPSMSFSTAFGLSLRNLVAKKGRTFLTAFAGSIGIIGIALIYAVSHGTTAYIDQVQEDTLASYPITLQAQYTDVSALIGAFAQNEEERIPHEDDAVYEQTMMVNLLNSFNSVEMGSNNLGSFNKELEKTMKDEDSSVQQAINAIHYSYNINPEIYTKTTDGNIIKSDSTEAFYSLLGPAAASMTSMSSSYSALNSYSSAGKLWQEITPGLNGELISPLFEKQYDVLYGHLPTAYNEVMLVVDYNNELPEIALYAMGLKATSDMQKTMFNAMRGNQIDSVQNSWSYERVCEQEYKLSLPCNSYVFNQESGIWTTLSKQESYDNGMAIKICGIAKRSADSNTPAGSSCILYTSALTDYLIAETEKAESVEWQKNNIETDMFTGYAFAEDNSVEKNLEKLGYSDFTNPSEISIYVSSFAGKDLVLDYIDAYNDSVEEKDQIEYTDYVGLIMSSVTKIINAITYVLIAFVAVSLIVSSIMIAVITLISVQERTKEIGILRSLGASKKNVSAMFNAETVIIGLFSGLIGVGFTYLVCIPINLILHKLTDINNLSAILPSNTAIILVCISFLLTLISGIIPSRSASKKDPVTALRTE